MTRPTLATVRAALRGLELNEVDFAVGDAFVGRLRDVAEAVNALDLDGEPWAREWLSAEVSKGGLIWTGAKVNWQREQAEGTHGAFNRQVRGDLIHLFNEWAAIFATRTPLYEVSLRSAADVATWMAELERFHRPLTDG